MKHCLEPHTKGAKMERKKCSQTLALELELWKLNKVHGRLLGRGRASAKMKNFLNEAEKKTFDAAAKPVRWTLRQGRRLRLCTCRDEFLEPKPLFPTRKIAELNARFKEQFLNERLEVAECPEGCGFHLERLRELLPSETPDDLRVFPSVFWNSDSEQKKCTCKTAGGTPKFLYGTRAGTQKRGRELLGELGKRLLAYECPNACGFHLSEWLPKKASGTSVTICNCKDKAGKPVAIFWTRALAEEFLPERRAGAKKSFKVCKCVEGKGYHIGGEDNESRWRREKQNRDLREGRDEPLGYAFGGIFGNFLDEPSEGARA